MIYGFFGVLAAYGAILVSASLSLLMLSGIAGRPVPGDDKAEPIRRRLATGLRFVFRHPVLLPSMALDMFGVLFGGAVSMLPVFAVEVLKVGPKELGFLRAAPMAGAVLMSLVLTWRPPMGRSGRSLLLAVTGFGASIILFALSRNLSLSLFFLFLSGLFDNISVVIRSTIMQLATPDEMRGRVASVNSIFIGSSNEIGSFESGVARGQDHGPRSVGHLRRGDDPPRRRRHGKSRPEAAQAEPARPSLSRGQPPMTTIQGRMRHPVISPLFT